MQVVIACPWFETLESFSMEVLVETDRVAEMSYWLHDKDGYDIAVLIEATSDNLTKLVDCYKACFGGNIDTVDIEHMPTLIVEGKRYYVSHDGWCWNR